MKYTTVILGKEITYSSDEELIRKRDEIFKQKNYLNVTQESKVELPTKVEVEEKEEVVEESIEDDELDELQEIEELENLGLESKLDKKK